ncbi:mobilization protein [Rhizobium sp. RAF36]|uniref:mobilization protein n=1 Tax=Rhizobium sp. RAF36 TaxID=3233055 RepID=UPI003F94EB3E
MTRKSLEERLAQLDAQKKALQARLTTQERARDTRRKVLLGSLVLNELTQSEGEFSRNLLAWLGERLPMFLTRDQDKAIFDDLLKSR